MSAVQTGPPSACESQIHRRIVFFFSYFLMEDIRLQCFRLVGAGLATISLGGVGMGIWYYFQWII